MCMGGGSVPNAPNTSAQSGSSSAIGQTAQTAGGNQLNWANNQVTQNGATTQGVQSQLNPLIGQQAGAGGAATQQFENQTLGGLNNQLQTAQDYGSPAGMAQASAAAAAQTGQAYNAARLNNQRQLGSYGVDPSQLKSGALNLNANLAQAGAVGNAAYGAGQQRQLTGMGLTSQALGQNLQAAGVGQGYTSGANATGSNIVGLGNQTTATGSSALSAPSQMLSTGLQGYGQSANIQNQAFQNQMTQYNAQQAGSNSLMSGLGSVAGMAAMAFMADGGAIPGRHRYADGGAPMVPVQGLPQIQQGAQYQAPQQSFGQGLGQGASQGFDAGITGKGLDAVQGAYYGGQSNGMLPTTTAQSGAAKDQFLQQPVNMAPPQFSAAGMGPQGQTTTFADGGIPQRKRMDYGSPPVQASQGLPPQVGIPGPWIAANGGSPGPGMIQHGPSDGTGIDDQVPAKVSVGEYIVPADVVHAKGKEFFDKLLQRYHIPAQDQRAQMGMH
jgi:hypothetical protein